MVYSIVNGEFMAHLPYAPFSLFRVMDERNVIKKFEGSDLKIN